LSSLSPFNYNALIYSIDPWMLVTHIQNSNYRPVLIGIWPQLHNQRIFLIVAKTMIRWMIRSLGSISFSHSPFAFLCIEREGREQKPEEVNKVEQLMYCIGNVSGSFELKSLPLSLSFFYKLYLFHGSSFLTRRLY